MENEFNEPKDTFLSQIIVTKNLDDVKQFAKETRQRIKYKLEEYREKDGRFDEKLFYLDQELFGKNLLFFI